MDEKQDKKDETVETIDANEVAEAVEETADPVEETTEAAERGEEATIDLDDPRRFNMVEPDQYNKWLPDFLGDGFEQMTLPLKPDDEGECVFTLIRHRPKNDPEIDKAPKNPRFAFLYIHGWNDYFYHPHIARTISQIGGAFFAIDLRKYGRSLRPGQTVGFIKDLSTYDEEIRLARRVIANELDPDIPLMLYGHSTGGLTAALWAQRHPHSLAGLVLNSPWLEFQSYTALRAIGAPMLSTLSRLAPKQEIPMYDTGFYQRTLTAWREGEEVHGSRTDEEVKAGAGHILSDPDAVSQRDPHPWASAETTDSFWTTGWQPDPRFRAYPSWAIRTGWLSAILGGHTQVAKGLQIDCPILVLTSTQSTRESDWCEEYLRTDSVLDVGQIWKRVSWLGNHVTLIKIPNAIHDVTLSREEVRTQALDHIAEFIKIHIGKMPLPPNHPRHITKIWQDRLLRLRLRKNLAQTTVREWVKKIR